MSAPARTLLEFKPDTLIAITGQNFTPIPFLTIKLTTMKMTKKRVCHGDVMNK